jgi:hypothetical protein
MKTLASCVRLNKTTLSLTVLALGFGLGCASPAQAQYSFFTSQGAWVSQTKNQTNVLFNGSNDVTTGNPVTGHVNLTTTQWDVSSSFAGNLTVNNGNGGNAAVTTGAKKGGVSDFTVSGTLAGTNVGALLFSVYPAAKGATANVYVNGVFDYTYTFKSSGDNFLGVIGPNIHSVEIAGNGVTFLDLAHIRVATPVPEFGTLLGLGGLLVAGGFAGLRRRKVQG